MFKAIYKNISRQLPTSEAENKDSNSYLMTTSSAINKALDIVRSHQEHQQIRSYYEFGQFQGSLFLTRSEYSSKLNIHGMRFRGIELTENTRGSYFIAGNFGEGQFLSYMDDVIENLNARVRDINQNFQLRRRYFNSLAVEIQT